MPRILKLQKVGDGIGVILDVSFLIENSSVRVLDTLELLRLQQEHQKIGAKEERERLNTEERERETHTELVKKLNIAHGLLARHMDQLRKAEWEIGQLLDNEGYEQ